MCGIIAAISTHNIVPLLIEGLRCLEYRGYDSCGISILKNEEFFTVRTTDRICDLDVKTKNLSSNIGIGHTRWATHGKPSTINAHPLLSHQCIAVVHNGIIENNEELRAELQNLGYTFESETDTEIIAHLIHHAYLGPCPRDLPTAVKHASHRLRGVYAIAVMAHDQAHRIIGLRHGLPLILGRGTEKSLLASDVSALAGIADAVYWLAEDEIVDLQLDQTALLRDGQWLQPLYTPLTQNYRQPMELAPYRYYMQKEIFEQPQAIMNTMEGVCSVQSYLFGAEAEEIFAQTERVLILACGSSFYASCTAKYWLESVAKLPTQVEVASEYRYRESVPDPKTLVVAVSQSGETADTLYALRHAKKLGHTLTLAICNVSGCTMFSEARLRYLTRAGLEIGVAATKAFLTQLLALYLLNLCLAKQRGLLPQEQERDWLAQLQSLPSAIEAVLALEPEIISWAEEFAAKENALFLGRGLHYPIALEGALKLKEISYIHAEAHPAGELKHGPLALVTEQMPVVTIAPHDALLEKLKSNMQEVRARGGLLYVCADQETQIACEKNLRILRLPGHYGLLSPILHTIPLQLLAYHTACARGTDVDKPRNLAKSVTVE